MKVKVKKKKHNICAVIYYSQPLTISFSQLEPDSVGVDHILMAAWANDPTVLPQTILTRTVAQKDVTSP